MREPSPERLFDKEIDFIDWLASLLNDNPSFSKVTLEPLLSPRGSERHARADIMAVRTGSGGSQTLLIECKNRPLYGRLVSETISQVKRYGILRPDARLVLAIPGRLSDSDRASLHAENLELWDLDTIARTFRKQLGKERPNVAMALETASTSLKTPEELLIGELHKCAKGKSQWPVYQKLVGRIIEHCFCPPLNSPLSESPDESGVNRRDFVLANFSDSGFWYHIRQRYSADYVVVDAKNYSGKVKKRDILQITNYLKHYGAGLFGIIFSRNGGDNSAHVTIREQWAHYQKLVIVLDDERCEAIINGTPSGESALILAKEIQDFRLSM
jgi:hypothetical protein